MTTIDAVLFDLDDTLHDDTAAYQAAAARVARDAAERTGIDAQALTAAYVREAERFWKALNAEHLATHISDTRETLWRAALAAIGVADETLARRCADDYVRYRNDELVPLPGAIDLLEGLRAAEIATGIVTNGFAATHHDKIRLLGMTALVDGIFIADEVGMLKPDPRLFRHACAALGSEPSRTAMVGDRFFRDVTGAHEAGLFTIYIDRHDEARAGHAVEPGATVASIAGVAAVLDPLLARPGALSERTERLARTSRAAGGP